MDKVIGSLPEDATWAGEVRSESAVRATAAAKLAPWLRESAAAGLSPAL